MPRDPHGYIYAELTGDFSKACGTDLTLLASAALQQVISPTVITSIKKGKLGKYEDERPYVRSRFREIGHEAKKIVGGGNLVRKADLVTAVDIVVDGARKWIEDRLAEASERARERIMVPGRICEGYHREQIEDAPELHPEP